MGGQNAISLNSSSPFLQNPAILAVTQSGTDLRQIIILGCLCLSKLESALPTGQSSDSTACGNLLTRSTTTTKGCQEAVVDLDRMRVALK